MNLSKVIDAAIANKKIIELNGNPMRLDLIDDGTSRLEEGTPLLHQYRCPCRADQLEFYLAGVNVARKGWLTKKDVINTLPLDEVVKFLSN